MRLTVQPGSPLLGELTLPGDKSLSHRVALLSALVQGESQVENFLVAGVTEAMLSALTALGVSWELTGTTLNVLGCGMDGLQTPISHIDCGNSATTMRLLAGLIAAAGFPAVLDGSQGLRRRPMGRIVQPLRLMGVPVSDANGHAPLVFSARDTPLKPLNYTLPVASAQVKSCLLLAALVASGSTTLTEPGPSRDHTERLLRSLGVIVFSEARNGAHTNNKSDSARVGAGSLHLHTGTRYTTRLVPPNPVSLPPLRLSLPGDSSSAAFLIVAALITPGSAILLRDVLLNPTRTGLLDALLAMGADIRIMRNDERYGEPFGDIQVRASRLRGTHVSGPIAVRMIDEFPAFAVAAAYASGETIVSDALELRHKESDRISALCTELNHLGIRADEKEDGFIIQGGTLPKEGEAGSHGDHRLAMSLAVAGLASAGPVVVREAGIISESFPTFTDSLRALGAQIRMEDE